MNSLKTLMVVAVLGAVAYGVYLQINRNPQTSNPPPGAPGWVEQPNVQMPGPGAGTSQFPATGSGLGAPIGATTAPPFSAGAAADNSVPAAGVSLVDGRTTTAPPFAPAPPDPSQVPVGNANVSLGDGRATGAPPFAPAPPDPSQMPVGNQVPVGSADRIADSAYPMQEAVGSPGEAGLAGPAVAGGGPDKFDAFMGAVQARLDKGELADALLALSALYGNPDVPLEKSQQVTELLDQLAGSVIYSREHLLEPPHTVRPGETVESIEQTYNVPWQVLARINGVPVEQPPQPGQELKVVRGPFSAVVDLTKYELTLMLNGRYAGRFPIGVGRDRERLEGCYEVRHKVLNPQYYGPDRIDIEADDPNNPYGEFWIGLGEQGCADSGIGIHGTSDPENLHRFGGRGTICLGNRDMDDLFGILSIGSRVLIRR